jgi:hypothetical protein
MNMPSYTAVANNDSDRKLMQQDKLRELAVVLKQAEMIAQELVG